MLGGDLSINPSPEDAPSWMLAQASSGNARVAYDLGLMGDSLELLPRMPAGIRQGWAHVHDRLLPTGKRAHLDEDIGLPRPYSSRSFRFNMPTGQRVKVTQQLVSVTGVDGTLEYGLRQTVTNEE
jgi:hypothetical protein